MPRERPKAIAKSQKKKKKESSFPDPNPTVPLYPLYTFKLTRDLRTERLLLRHTHRDKYRILTPSSPSWLLVRRMGSGTGRFMSEWIWVRSWMFRIGSWKRDAHPQNISLFKMNKEVFHFKGNIWRRLYSTKQDRINTSFVPFDRKTRAKKTGDSEEKKRVSHLQKTIKF